MISSQIENNSSNKSPRSASSRHAFVDEYEMDAERGVSARRVQDEAEGDNGCCAALLTFFSILLCIVTFPISIWMVVKQVQVRNPCLLLI